MAECIKGEEGTLACSADPVPVTPNPANPGETLIETINTAMCDATYDEILGLDASISLSSTLNEVVIPLLDFPGAEARCVTNKDFSITFSGIACPGQPGYDCLFELWCNPNDPDPTKRGQPKEGFWRYRWLGAGAGNPDIYGLGFVNMNLTNGVDDVARWSATVNFRLDKTETQV